MIQSLGSCAVTLLQRTFFNLKQQTVSVRTLRILCLTVLVSIKDYGNSSVKTWSFENAYPVKLIVSELSASKNEAVIETLELAYRRFELVS